MFQNLKNSFDFYLRNKLTWGRPLSSDTPIHEKALKLQSEILEFLKIFSWEKYYFNKRLNIKIVDVGARTFSFAPAFEKFFLEFASEINLSGIEIDAYRRFTNLRTRRDYGEFYAKKVSHGRYFASDFLKFEEPVDFIMMLHPFVTPEPHGQWGLPKSKFKPELLFRHSYKLLKKNSGAMLLSNPTEEEFEIAKKMAFQSGFVLLEEKSWMPSEDSIQQQPRLGALFTS